MYREKFLTFLIKMLTEPWPTLSTNKNRKFPDFVGEEKIRLDVTPQAGPKKRPSRQPTNLVLRAVDPHSFFADPDPAVLLNADPDPAA